MIQWGIIGCGAVCEKKSGPAFALCQGSTLRAVMRRTPGAARDYAERHGVPAWYETADALLADPEVNAVYIATPPGRHLEYALAACAAGKPCYIEKPMARDYAECLRMIRAFEKAGLPLFVAYYRRAQPHVLQMRDWIKEGRLGTIHSVRCHYQRDLRPPSNQPLPWRYRREESGGGILLDLGSHTLDLLDFLLGPLDVIEARVERVCPRYEVEDRISLSFRCGESSGRATFDYTRDPREDNVLISGDRGTLRFATFGPDPVVLETREERIEMPYPQLDHVQQPMIQTVVNALLGTGICESTGRSAARTSRVMDQILTFFQ